MHLADAGLGDTKNLTDLGQGESFEVIEGHHNFLPLWQAVDRFGEDALHLLGFERIHRADGLRVLEGIDQRQAVTPLAVDTHQFVEGNEGHR